MISDTIWYNTGDLVSPPRQAKVLRQISKTPADTEYVCKDILESHRVVLTATQMFDRLQSAKDAKIATINSTIKILNDTAVKIQGFTEDDVA